MLNDTEFTAVFFCLFCLVLPFMENRCLFVFLCQEVDYPIVIISFTQSHSSARKKLFKVPNNNVSCERLGQFKKRRGTKPMFPDFDNWGKCHKFIFIIEKCGVLHFFRTLDCMNRTRAIRT